MKILVLSHEYPPIGGGGGMVAKDLAVGLAGKGHEIVILTTKVDNEEIEALPPNIQVKRVSTFRKSAFRAGLIDMAAYNIAALWHGMKIMRQWKPDLIHAHFAVPAGAVALLLSRLYKKPYIITAHLGDVPGAVPSKTDDWFRWMLPFTHSIWSNASNIVAVSEFTRQLALRHYPVNITVIHNGVELNALQKPTLDPSSTQPTRLIFAGRFAEQKNPSHLVQALAPLKGLAWECNMLGDGPLYEQTRQQAKEYGIENQFVFFGWVTPDQVKEAFLSNDILVLPSSSEGLSVVGVQALAMGLAMVLSNAGGNPELVNGMNGALFEVGDVTTLTNTLRTYITDRSALITARKNSLEFAKKFDLGLIVDQYESIFKEIVQ